MLPSKPSSPLVPVSCLLISATLWGVSWYPLRLLEQAGVNGIWSSFLVYFGVAVLGSLFLWRHKRILLSSPWPFVVVAVGHAWCNVAFILAVLDGNVVRVMLLFYLSPLWATLLGWKFLDERLSKLSLITLAIAMIGAVIMLWDPALGMPWPQSQADWLALTSGMGFACANVAVRKIQHVPLMTKAVVSWWGVALLAAIWIVVGEMPMPDVSLNFIAATVILGGMVITVMTITVLYGVSHLPIYRSAVILLFELVIGVLSSQWLTNEIIGPLEWIGGSLIITAAYLSARVGADPELQ